jgi:hypothetical protein
MPAMSHKIGVLLALKIENSRAMQLFLPRATVRHVIAVPKHTKPKSTFVMMQRNRGYATPASRRILLRLRRYRRHATPATRKQEQYQNLRASRYKQS